MYYYLGHNKSLKHKYKQANKWAPEAAGLPMNQLNFILVLLFMFGQQ